MQQTDFSLLIDITKLWYLKKPVLSSQMSMKESFPTDWSHRLLMM